MDFNKCFMQAAAGIIESRVMGERMMSTLRKPHPPRAAARGLPLQPGEGWGEGAVVVFIIHASLNNLSRILRNYSGGRCASLSARNNALIWVWYHEPLSFFLRLVLTIVLVKGVCL
jgi:hypothetical protein